MGRVCYVRANESPGAYGSGLFVLVGRVALADFFCARRRGLAKIRALPLLQLGCICRKQRLACAAVQDPNGHVSAMPRQNKNPGPVASGFVLMGRVALADFSCARRRGLAKIRALPLLCLACFVRWTRLGCAAVQDSNRPRLLCPGKTKARGLRPRAFVWWAIPISARTQNLTKGDGLGILFEV